MVKFNTMVFVLKCLGLKHNNAVESVHSFTRTDEVGIDALYTISNKEFKDVV